MRTSFHWKSTDCCGSEVQLTTLSLSCDIILNCPFRSAPPQRWRQIQAHFERPNSNPNGVSSQTQAQPRKRTDIGGKVGAASNVLYNSPTSSNANEHQWLMADVPCVSDGSGRWARSAVKVIREQYRHQQCSTGHRAPRLHGVRLPALPVRFPPMCTTHQLWTNHLLS